MGVIVTKPRASLSIIKESAIGTIDGSNDSFTTSRNFLTGTLSVFYRGLREFNITPLGGNSFRMPIPPRVGSSLYCEYIQG
jgi:hypothetical protein